MPVPVGRPGCLTGVTQAVAEQVMGRARNQRQHLEEVPEMSTTTETTTTTTTTTAQPVEDLKLEAVVIPVSDVDRSKAYFNGLGWRLDADFAFDNGFRVVQFNAPGSPASVQFGTGITTAEPGSAQ